MLKELQRFVGYYLAVVVCWVSEKLDDNLWEEE